MNNNIKKTWLLVLLILFALILLFLLFAGAMVFNHYYNLLDVQIETQDIEYVADEELLQKELDFLEGIEEEPDSEGIEDEFEEETEEVVAPFEDLDISEEAFNIMIVGIDSRDNDFAGRTDSMILFSINPDTKKAVMTSFLRDMYVKIPEHGGNRLNAAYAFGGTSLLSQTISNNFGIAVDDYVIVNFWLVMDVVDAFGGVEISVEPEEIEYVNYYLEEHNRLLEKPEGTDYLTAEDTGVRLLNGSQALGYARIRYVGTDFGRTSRQREIISALIEKLKGMNILEINSLLEQFLPRVRTNLSQKDLTTLLFMSLGIKDYTIESMAIPVDDTWEYAQIRGMSVIEVDFEANAKAWRDKIMGSDQ
jgi:LCP family protein required for cell wall assembly